MAGLSIIEQDNEWGCQLDWVVGDVMSLSGSHTIGLVDQVGRKMSPG